MSTYWFSFGNASPATFTALSPTFSAFVSGGTNVLPLPAIFEVTGTGWYYFNYNANDSFAYTADGITSSLGIYRYSANRVSSDFIGYTGSSIGDTLTDPSTAMGYLKRIQELLEGNQTFNKTSGALDYLTRGSSLLLREKIITDSLSLTSRS